MESSSHPLSSRTSTGSTSIPKSNKSIKTGFRTGNSPGFKSKKEVSSPAVAVAYQKASIKKASDAAKNSAKIVKLAAKSVQNSAKKAAEAATKRAALTAAQNKKEIHSGELHTQSMQYANSSRTRPAQPHNPQNAGSKSQFEEVTPKKYKKAPNLKDKQIMGMNATFGNTKGSGAGDTTQVTSNPYESTQYNIPFDRKDSEGKPIGYDKTVDSKDTKKQLNRRKAMKIVKAYVNEEGIGGEGTSGGWGGADLVDGGRQDGGKNYTLAKNPESKNYKLKKKFKQVRESGFTEPTGAGDTGGGAGDGFPVDDKMDNLITVPEKLKKKKKIEEFSVPEGTTGKRKKVFSAMIPIRMADGTIKKLPPGKSGSSGH